MTAPLSARRGLKIVEVVVVVAIVGIVAIFALIRAPRSRESARLLSCKSNLMQIGFALTQYHDDAERLPIARIGGEGPLRACLEVLAIPDFSMVTDPKKRSPKQPGFVIKEGPVRGFICPTDRNATAGRLAAPISYRGSTGSSGNGRGGAFDLGAEVTFSQVEAGDGLSHTSAFSERLVGDLGPANRPTAATMQFVPSALNEPPCPEAAPGAWLTDAGASWWVANWNSTLYNHSATPNTRPNCLSADGRSGIVSASSEHLEGVNVLLLDGSVRTYGIKVDPGIWRALGTIQDSPVPAPTPPASPSTPAVGSK